MKENHGRKLSRLSAEISWRLKPRRSFWSNYIKLQVKLLINLLETFPVNYDILSEVIARYIKKSKGAPDNDSEKFT